jgi:hypothetical protein
MHTVVVEDFRDGGETAFKYRSDPDEPILNSIRIGRKSPHATEPLGVEHLEVGGKEMLENQVTVIGVIVAELKQARVKDGPRL